MRAFSDLLERLVLTPGRNAKLSVLTAYFASTPDPDRGLALAAIVRELSFKAVKAGLIRELAKSRIDEQLFAMSYDFVGDLAETISLSWPEKPGANRPPDLPQVIETLQNSDRQNAIEQLEHWMDALDAPGRWALIKLITGGLRIGLSTRLAKQALADYGGVTVEDIEEIWHGLEIPYSDLFAWLEGRGEKPQPDDRLMFRPMMLAHPLIAKKNRDNLDSVDQAPISAEHFACEWKWDGIRVQAVGTAGEKRLFSRNGDDISAAFPDIIQALEFDGVIDGELLIRSPQGGVSDFNTLQQRLNRKTAPKKLQASHPAFLRAYDLLRSGDHDLRTLPFKTRRTKLEQLAASLRSDRLDLSQLVQFESLEQLDLLRNQPPSPEIEGVMLKRWDSPYIAGRPKGQWYKFKRDPFVLDAVLLYAQRGHGRRSGQFSDFTFAVWRNQDGDDILTPIGKTYFGFTDNELKLLNKFIKENTKERFGPVTSITANKETGLVLEVAFEGVQRSTRHKSGFALRFPRINHIRWDKPPSEADRLEALEAILNNQ